MGNMDSCVSSGRRRKGGRAHSYRVPTMSLLRNVRGLALLEVLIAGVILGIAIIGLALLFSSGQSFVVAEGDERVAIYLAQQKIEKLRGLGFSAIPVGGSSLVTGCSNSPPTEPCYSESPVPGSPRYTRTTVVECVDPNSFATVTCGDPITAKRITVTVDPQMAQADTITVDSVLTLH